MSKAEETRIQDVLAKPFGPYLDSLILEKKCTTTGKESAVLHSVMMECGGQVIGFDETEFEGADPKARINQYPVRFRGVLEIIHLDWLTPVGKKYLQQDIRKRDIDIHLFPHSVNPTSDLTLERIYRRDPVIRSTGRGPTVKVIIQGQKSLSAMFLTSNILPNGLLLHALDQGRRFEVRSLDVETHNLSESFFMRYRLVTLMRCIIETDPKKTDIEDRNINYFVDAYISRFSAGYGKKNLYRRLIFDLDDSDVDDDGNTTQKRHLRTVHRSDIMGIFASHAEWILKDQLDRREKAFLDIKSWSHFCKQVNVGRREAKGKGKRWGFAHGEDGEIADSHNTIDFAKAGIVGDQLALYNRKLLRQNNKVSKAKSAAKNKGKGKARQVIVSEEEDDMEQDGEDEADETELVHQQNIYDSDFSVASSPPASASSDDDSELENPDIAALIPPEFWHPPQPPGLDFQWHCPARDCPYNINLLALTAENTKGLDGAMAKFLRAKQWKKMYDAKVLKGFYEMASDHYNDHMLRVGVIWENYCEKNGRLVWINPKRHPPWPPSNTTSRRGGGHEIVKQEHE